MLGAILAVGLLAAAPGAASAALFVSDSGTLTYNARAGDANDIQIALVGADYVVSDSVAIDDGGGCTVSDTTATCPAEGVTSIRVNAGDQNDTVSIDASVTVPAQLFGRDGDDTLSGGSGNDVLNGYTGDDTLVGNGGSDFADYSSSPAGAGVTVDLAAGTATGVGTDSIDPTVENVRGTAADDAINSRNGAGGTVQCGNGQDAVISDPVDVVAADCEDNRPGPETQLDSTPGEVVDTATPSFTFSSPDGPGTTFACRFDDGNFFQCEPPVVPDPPLQNGQHTFEVVAIDRFGNQDQTPARFTFTVSVSGPPAPPAPPPPDGTTTQVSPSNVVIIGSLVLISGRSVKLVKGRLVPVRLTCAGRRTCEGRVTITTDKPVRSKAKAKKRRKRKPRVARLGSVKFSIEGNRRARVLVPLKKSKIRLLRRLKRVKARATIRELDPQGRPRISTRTFMLRAR